MATSAEKCKIKHQQVQKSVKFNGNKCGKVYCNIN